MRGGNGALRSKMHAVHPEWYRDVIFMQDEAICMLIPFEWVEVGCFLS